MGIVFHNQAQEFHLYNKEVSYVIKVLPNGQLGNLYYGKRIHDRESFKHLLETGYRPLTTYIYEDGPNLSLHCTRQEYPSYGTTDFHEPAFEIEQVNGSHIANFEYKQHEIFQGKKMLEGLPATYIESISEATTLEIILYDCLIETELLLTYTIFEELPVITRHAKFMQKGEQSVFINRAMSMAIDFPDYDYEMLHFAGAWSREREIKMRKIEQGLQSIYSLRGSSSAEHNPFLILKRPSTNENQGEAYGFSLVYSGNFLAQVEVDSHYTTRVIMGIHPHTFRWILRKDESFQTPEVVMTYSDCGLNKMSQTYHKLYRTRLVRGFWRDRVRPVLCNNWEATAFNFNEEKILHIAKAAANLGVELFVLDDGWFGKRDNDREGLGDWYVNIEKLPSGITGLAKKIKKMGMNFGLWIEPEMVNKESELYKKHPDWVIHTPGRRMSQGRNQYVLDYSRAEVVDYIYEMISKILREVDISYIKWDMNRYITECYSSGYKADAQGEIMHRYILGVYHLYEKLTTEFPHILFESCSSGGARFDPGMLYYAPQTWTSDDTDAYERLKIQYSTSYVYPLSSMGAHISEIPNQQTLRSVPLETRANVAYFGAFGYELDLNLLSEQEKELVKKQIEFVKKHRELIHKGRFYRLESPYNSKAGAWMVVSENRDEALVGYYKGLNEPNAGYIRLRLKGLEEDASYYIDQKFNNFYGDELMYVGLVIDEKELCSRGADFSSVLYHLKVK